MQTEFILYSGSHTIGGVNAEVRYGKDRVLFEFGSSYDPKTNVFDGVVEKREKNWISDMLRLGILPRIDGIFRRCDLLNVEGIVPAEESDDNTAVFITHLHLDHMAFMGTVAPEIPVYLHANSQLIERALEDTGEGIDTLERTYTDLVPNQPVRVGQIEVTPLLTDARSYCHLAFYITTPDGSFHWTGDLVLHGLGKELSFAQIPFLQNKGVDVLLCDCTSFMDNVLEMMYDRADPTLILPSPEIPANMLSEEQLNENLFRILQSQKGLCVFNYYQRETYEAKQFMDWAERTGRICAFEPDAAYIVFKALGVEPNVYIPDSPRYPADSACQPAWFRELLQHSKVVSLSEIRTCPGKYLIQNSYRHILELFSLPSDGGAYLHAEGIPIGDFDPAYQKMQRLVSMSGFSYVTFFCENFFGHGYPCQVKYFVDAIDPHVLIPCHSFNPERLLPLNGKQLIPKLGQRYILSNHDLIAVPAEQG